jgi:soluble lytic murein transglycosylase
MKRRLKHLPGIYLTLTVLLITSPLPGCSQDSQPNAGASTDSDESVEPEALVEEAQTLLETSRPWRAAQIMQQYLEVTPDPSPRRRLLAARAEAGWDHWTAVDDVLEDTPELDSLAQGLGLYLLARAHDAAGKADAATQAYRRFLEAAPAEHYTEEKAAARLRRGLALLRAGRQEKGEAILAEVSDAMGPAALWVDLLKAEVLAQTGEAAAARQAASRYRSGLPGLRARRAQIEAERSSGNLIRARELAREGYAWAQTDATRAEFKLIEGQLAFAQEDSTAGRKALRRAIALNEAGTYGQEAAALLREGGGSMSAADHLASARVYAGMGMNEEAAADFRVWLDADTDAPTKRESVRFELARTLIAGQMYDEALDVLEPLGDDRTARELRASALSRQGATEKAARIYRELATSGQRGTSDRASALYFAADAYQQGGNAAAARPLYHQLIHQYPEERRWRRLAMMRLAGLAFLKGNYGEAAAIWDRYRQHYPNGPLVVQSTYWAARARAEQGASEAAERLFRKVRRMDRDSYYALKASDRVGESFWPLPMGEAPAPAGEAARRRLAGWMEAVDRLREAGFHDAASAEADRVTGRAGSSRAVRYALAEALAERGYTRRAIRIGLQLQGGETTNPRLLRILYPYPYRDLIRAEAEEHGIPSSVAPALIRQESMFEARITSPVGARGLMQIMPSTGADLAQAEGLESWDPDYLYQPEINVHLGMSYIAEGLDVNDGSLPATFSAYNAGPHQVEQWRTFPEFKADQELFTERIPFRETRNYVKKIMRNRAIYEGLYEGSTGVD